MSRKSLAFHLLLGWRTHWLLCWFLCLTSLCMIYALFVQFNSWFAFISCYNPLVEHKSTPKNTIKICICFLTWNLPDFSIYCYICIQQTKLAMLLCSCFFLTASSHVQVNLTLPCPHKEVAFYFFMHMLLL